MKYAIAAAFIAASFVSCVKVPSTTTPGVTTNHISVARVLMRVEQAKGFFLPAFRILASHKDPRIEEYGPKLAQALDRVQALKFLVAAASEARQIDGVAEIPIKDLFAALAEVVGIVRAFGGENLLPAEWDQYMIAGEMMVGLFLSGVEVQFTDEPLPELTGGSWVALWHEIRDAAKRGI